MIAINQDLSSKIEFKIYDPVTQYEVVKEKWLLLEKKCSHSYWLSWEWNEIWIKELPTVSKLFLVVGLMDEQPVIAFFIGTNHTLRNRFFMVEQMALNQTLISQFDVINYVEYNAILIDPEVTITLDRLLDSIPIKSWDEFQMMRFAPMYNTNLLMDHKIQKKYDIELTKQDSYYVDLDKVRKSNNNYLALLSQNRRHQIRRSLKEYEKIGSIQLVVADSSDIALNIFQELINLHQKRWTERGERGAFSTQYDVDCHKKLIMQRFNHGEIQLIKISAGDYIIGCLYNFVYNRKVFQVQGGFNYMSGNNYRPGFVCHYLAILYNSEIGLDSYDFLADGTDYKVSLSTDYNEMKDLILTKKTYKYTIAQLLRQIYLLSKKFIASYKSRV